MASTLADGLADRMFTSRSEYRISIRADNADTRLTEKARLVGAVHDTRWNAFSSFKEQLAEGSRLLQEFSQSPQGWAKLGLIINKDGMSRSAFDMLALPGIACRDLLDALPALRDLDTRVLDRLDIDGHYAHHVKRQSTNIAAFLRDEALDNPPELDYMEMPGLSSELKERLTKARPTTFGAAQRVEGATPGGLLTLYKHLKSQKRSRGGRRLIPPEETSFDNAALGI